MIVYNCIIFSTLTLPTLTHSLTHSHSLSLTLTHSLTHSLTHAHTLRPHLGLAVGGHGVVGPGVGQLPELPLQAQRKGLRVRDVLWVRG